MASNPTETSSNTMGKCVLPPCNRCQKRESINESTERFVHDGQRMPALAITDLGDTERAAQFARVDFQRAGPGRCAGGWLREGRGHRGMKRGVALDFPEHLVDVTV